MRLPLLAALAGAVCLLSGSTLRAGVYNPEEPPLMPARTWTFSGQLRPILQNLRSIGVPQPKDPTYRNSCLARVAALEELGRWSDLSVSDRVSLSAYYLRLQRPDDLEKAVKVLGPAEAAAPDNFMVLANLATANHLAGRLDRALDYQQQVLKVWPDLWPGFTRSELAWLRQAERSYATLLELRQQESRTQTGRTWDSVDALFPGVHFVGVSGEYEPGGIAPEQLDEMPSDAGLLVSQLLLWMPFDGRLYWLLGELLNAQGDIESACAIMDELVFSGAANSHSEMGKHLRILQQVREAFRTVESPRGAVGKEHLLWATAPRGAIGVPGAGGLCSELAWVVALANVQKLEQNQDLEQGSNPSSPATGPTPSRPVTPPLPSKPWLPDWRTFLVGLVFGGILAWLLGQQVRHMRQRAQSKERVMGAG